MSYQRVIDKLQENGLSWSDVDRIELNPETYEDFLDRASFDTADHFTEDRPAVRKTVGDERIIYVSGDGRQVTVKL